MLFEANGNKQIAIDVAIEHHPTLKVALISRLFSMIRQNDVTANLLMGVLFHQGVCVKKNEAKANLYFNSAQRSGCPHAALFLGLSELDSEKADADKTRGVELLEHAADNGVVRASYELGLWLSGNNASFFDVFSHYFTASESAVAGSFTAMAKLAQANLEGHNIPDLGTPNEWLNRGAIHGDPESQYLLGNSYLTQAIAESQQRKPSQQKILSYAQLALKWLNLSQSQGEVRATDALSKLSPDGTLKNSDSLVVNNAKAIKPSVTPLFHQEALARLTLNKTILWHKNTETVPKGYKDFTSALNNIHALDLNAEHKLIVDKSSSDYTLIEAFSQAIKTHSFEQVLSTSIGDEAFLGAVRLIEIGVLPNKYISKEGGALDWAMHMTSQVTEEQLNQGFPLEMRLAHLKTLGCDLNATFSKVIENKNFHVLNALSHMPLVTNISN